MKSYSAKLCLNLGLVTAISLAASSVNAYSECKTGIKQLFAGRDGSVWLQSDIGGTTYILPTDGGVKNVLAVATTAITTGKKVLIRYASDTAKCTDMGRPDFVGIELIK